MLEQWMTERQACNFYDLSVTSRTIGASMIGLLTE